MKKVGVCFSKGLQGNEPLHHIGTKLPVYTRLLDLIEGAGWEAYVLTRRTYRGNRIFSGGWKYSKGKFHLVKRDLSIDLVYDRTGGVNFPPKDNNLTVVNPRDFKILCWDKWATSKEIGQFMPKTILIENEGQIAPSLSKIKTKRVVLKPFNGLKGMGIFIGDKLDALNFKFPGNFPKYIMQEFVDTSGGIAHITPGTHDLRVVIVNSNPVWCHVRVPAPGSLLANAALGGDLTEVDYEIVPENIKEVVHKITKHFSENYDNPIYSLDFGVGKDRSPYIFEINDQIGFPKWEMRSRDSFLLALITNFRLKLQ